MGTIISLILAGMRLIGLAEAADQLFKKWQESQKQKAIIQAEDAAPRTADELIERQKQGKF